MTRKSSAQAPILSVVTLFIAALTFFVAPAASAQQTGTSRPSANASAALPQQPSAPLQPWPRLVVQGTAASQGVPASRSQGKKAASAAVDSQGVSFLPPVLYNTGEYSPSSVAIADVNADGIPDLIVADQSGIYESSEGSVSVLLGNGDGTFQPPVNYDSGGEQAYSVAVADLTGNGKPDIVVGNGCATGTHCSPAEGTIGVLLGNGDGTFQAALAYSSGGNNSSSVAIADLNGDGNPDVAVSNNGSDTVSILLGNGDGTFQTAVSYNSGGIDPTSVAIGDVSGDGKPDLLVSNYCPAAGCGYPNPDGVVGVLLGNGDGTFQAAVTYDAGAGATWSVTAADLSGNGKLDLLTTNCGLYGCSPGNPWGPALGVLLGNGDGTFQAAIDYAAGNSPLQAAFADVNGDGKLDVVVANWGTFSPPPNDPNAGALSVLLGNGDGTLQAPVTYLTGATYEATSVAVADLNGDGKPDVVTGNYNGYELGTVSVLLNSTPTFTTTTLVSSPNPSAYGQSVTFTATVTSSSGTPTGTAQLLYGSTVLGTGTLTNGVTSISVSSLPLGSDSVTASYQGSANFAPSTSASLIQTVLPGSTTTLSASPSPAYLDLPVTLTAQVTSAFGTPTGIVIFYGFPHRPGGPGASWELLCEASLSGGIASCVLSPLQKDYLFQASYSGNLPGSSAELEELVIKRFETSTSLISSPNPSSYGQAVTFTATVISPSAAIPDGSAVNFNDGGKKIGTGSTVGGVATFTTSTLKNGTHTIKAAFPEGRTFAASSATVTQVVTAYSTTTTLTSSLNPSTYGQTVTWTATVTTTGPDQPTGKVKFVGVGGAPTLSGGVATFSKTWLNAATYAITAEYEGDDANAPSSSATLNQVVNPTSTTTTVTSSANPSSQGQNVTFTATVTTSTGVNSAGTVTFTAGGTTLGTATLSSNVASVTTSALPVGTTVVLATYNGETNFTGSVGSVMQVVNQ